MVSELAGEGPLEKRGEFGYDATPYGWPPLDQKGRRLQHYLVEQYHAFCALMHASMNRNVHGVQSAFHEARATVESIIQRQACTYELAGDAASAAVKAFVAMLKIFDGVHSDHEELIVVPDTNALYWNPALECWRTPDDQPFLIALTPVVIEELDRHKAERKDSVRRKKAERLVRQIGEYRQRGVLADGVQLSPRSRILASAAYGEAREFLPWLIGFGPDDLFLGSALATMRRNPRAPTALVTRDMNLQTKIEMARLSFWEPRVLSKAATPEKTDG
jgi:hypothetical protein